MTRESSGGWEYPDWDPTSVWFLFPGCTEGGLSGYTVWDCGVVCGSIGG